MAVARHRQNHIERPARAVLAAVDKGRTAREEREQVVAAAEGGDLATAFLSLERIAADLRKVQERLERTAGAAEVDKQRLAVASLSGQQLRAAEVRAKLGGLGGYAPPRYQTSNGPKLELNIIFSGGLRERIEATPFREVEASEMPIVPDGGRSIGNASFPVPDDRTEIRDEDENFDEDV
jgi:hypothetical protein